MSDLRQLSDTIGQLFVANSHAQKRASRLVKFVLVIGGAAVAAIAQAVEIAHAVGHISAWTITGLGSAVLVALGGFYVLLTEEDAAQALEGARQAIDAARLLEQQMEEFKSERKLLDKQVRRGLELYNSMDVLRGAIEQSLELTDVTAAKIIQTGLDAACNSLLVVFDFEIEDTWTISVYEAQNEGESGKVVLRCVAQQRKIQCKIEEARVWPEGVGVAGVSYSMNNETIIPDMSSPELGTVFNLHSNAREYDNERYRSMVSVPVNVGERNHPWGVVVVTCDKPHHFDVEPPDGVSTAEPVRAIAAMAALAVKAVEAGERRSLPADPDTVPTSIDEGSAQIAGQDASTKAPSGGI